MDNQNIALEPNGSINFNSGLTQFIIIQGIYAIYPVHANKSTVTLNTVAV